MAAYIRGIIGLCVVGMCMSCPNYRFSPKDQFMQDLNAKRQQEGLSALSWDDALGNAAASFNDDCRATTFEDYAKDCNGNTVGVLRVYMWRDINNMVDYIYETKRWYMSGRDSDFQGQLYNTMFNDQATKVGCSFGADPGCYEDDFLYCATDVYVPYVIKSRN